MAKNMPTRQDNPQRQEWGAGNSSARATRAVEHATNTASVPAVKVQPSPAVKNKVGVPNGEKVLGKPFPKFQTKGGMK